MKSYIYSFFQNSINSLKKLKEILRMNVPVFIDISLEEQAEELRAWMKSQGAEISEERSEIGELCW